MGAGKHRIVEPERPGNGLTQRELDCRDAIRKDVEARDALHFLVEKARRTEEWWITTFVVTVWTEQTIRKSHKTPPGEFEAEELLKIVTRLFETVETIRKLNTQRHWRADCPDASIFSDDDKHREFVGENTWSEYVYPSVLDAMSETFKNLPNNLEVYAKSVRMKAMRELGYRRMDKGGPNLQHKMEVGLLEYVQKLTGRKYREKVAAILRVVNAQAGVRPVESESLRKREQRMKAKLKK
jgi:hypothetical protein